MTQMTAAKPATVPVTLKVLLAPDADVPRGKGDFAWTTPGEIVMHNEKTCESHAGANACGCNRAFVGTSSAKSTTVAVVATMSGAEFIARMTATGYAAGWPGIVSDDDVRRQAMMFAATLAEYEDGSTFGVKVSKTRVALLPRDARRLVPEVAPTTTRGTLKTPCHGRRKTIEVPNDKPSDLVFTCTACGRAYDAAVRVGEKGLTVRVTPRGK